MDAHPQIADQIWHQIYIYELHNRPCTKLTGPDAQIHLASWQNTINNMASQLTPGDWVLFKSEGDEDQPF
eukprot:4821310-Ditylum_brightwellii.AAC.1